MPYAVLAIGGKQYLVRPGGTLRVEKLDRPEGSVITLDEVLLVRPDEGEPLIRTADQTIPYQVVATVVRHERDRKIVVFKKRRKETYKKKQGHRQWKTVLRIDEIRPMA